MCRLISVSSCCSSFVPPQNRTGTGRDQRVPGRDPNCRRPAFLESEPVGVTMLVFMVSPSEDTSGHRRYGRTTTATATTAASGAGAATATATAATAATATTTSTTTGTATWSSGPRAVKVSPELHEPCAVCPKPSTLQNPAAPNLKRPSPNAPASEPWP